MIKLENPMTGVFFTCDKCGKEYSFSGSFLAVMKGRSYRPYGHKGDLLIAEMDLCRDCAGQSEKLGKGEAQLAREIAEIDAATNSLLAK